MALLEAQESGHTPGGKAQPRGVVADEPAESSQDQPWRLRGVSADVSGAQFLLSGRTLVGRNRTADLVLQAPQVSRQHAELEVIEGGLALRDLGSTNGTYVNGDKTSTATLHTGDVVRFDVVEFEILGPDADSDQTVARLPPQALRQAVAEHERARISEPRLVMRTGPLAGRKFPLLKSVYSLGRNNDNDIVVDDPSVSRRHARFSAVDGDWYVEDLGATNGVRINGEPVKRGRLYDGDRVRLGKVRVKFEAPAVVAEGALAAESAGEVQRRSGYPTGASVAGISGLVGLLLVMLSAFYLNRPGTQDSPGGQMLVGPPLDGELQILDTWRRALTNARRHPTSPALADINGDGWLDILVADAAGYLTALDGEEGKRIFEADLTGRVVAPVVSADLGGDGKADIVVASYEGVVYAINGKAQLLWRSRLDRDLGRIVSAPLLHDLTGDAVPDVIVSTTQRGLVALDGARGWELWSSVQVGLRQALTAPVAADLDGDAVVDLVTTAQDGTVWALAARGRTVWKLWSRPMPSPVYATVAVSATPDPVVVALTEGHGAFGLFGASGLVSWRLESKVPYLANPTVIGAGRGVDRVIMVSVDGELAAVEASTGQVQWRRSLEREVQSSPLLAPLGVDGEDLLVVLDMRGGVELLDPADGKAVLTAPASDGVPVVASAVAGDVNHDGLIDLVVPGDDGVVRVLTLNRTVNPGTAVWPEFGGPARRHGTPP